MLSTASMKRIILALLTAPFPAALFQSIVVALWPKPGKGVFEHPLSMFVAVCLLFYLVELLLALPLYFAMRRRLPRRATAYGIAGAVLALVPIGLGLGLAAAKGGLTAYVVIYNLLFFGVGGFVAGLTFWAIGRPGAHLGPDSQLRPTNMKAAAPAMQAKAPM